MSAHGALRVQRKDTLSTWSDLLLMNAKTGSSRNKKIYKEMRKKLPKRFPECASEIVYQIQELIKVEYQKLGKDR
jgi:hypothetical protein